MEKSPYEIIFERSAAKRGEARNHIHGNRKKEKINIRVVQKPQFLNNFPEKNREFAAICGKFSGTWERTARFLNKSIKFWYFEY
jgi:hypothetical protein